MAASITPHQTVGPYFRIGLSHLYVNEILGNGERFTVRGRVLDGDAAPVDDTMIEIWQADAEGKYASSAGSEKYVRGFGRIATDATGAFRFSTVKPGRVPGPDATLQAPHLAVAVFMRGLLKHLVTRVYFPDEPSNLEDPILKLVPPERRPTLIAKPVDTDAKAFEWNVILQGRDETVFFDF